MTLYHIKEDTLKAIAEKLRNIKNSDELILVGNFASEVEGVGNTLKETVDALKSLIEGSAVDLIIPDGVTKINTYAFTGFTSLRSITIPETVTRINDVAFSWCSSLPKIKIPRNVSYIGSLAFTNCMSCLEYDFSDHESIPELGANAFGSNDNRNPNMKIIVPESLYNDFCYATTWADYHHNLVSIGKSEMNYVPIETVWLMSNGSYRYVANKSVPLTAYYKINDGEAIEFGYNNPAFGSLQFSQMYDGDTGYYMYASGDLHFNTSGTYEIWVEDSSTGVKYYRRIVEVSA